MQTTL